MSKLDLMLQMLNVQAIELALWRERFPIQAAFIREQAAAKSEGREPRYMPPVAIGAR